MTKILSACAGIALAGVMLGYIGSFSEYRNEVLYGDAQSKWKVPWLAFVAAPGKITARSLRYRDYGPTEAWRRDRHRIALWNGLFLAPLGLLAGLGRRAENE